VKTVQLEGLRVVGDPYGHASQYEADDIDEILYLDIVASLYGRNSLASLVERTTADVFCPVAVAGGIRSVEDAQTLLRVGADKIVVNTAAVRRPQLLTELALKFGSQCVVLQLDAKRNGSGWEAWTDGGREPSGRDAVAWAMEAVSMGAGEVLLTSIDREGTCSGCDLDLISMISHAVPAPVIASGGVGVPRNGIDAFLAGANAVAMAHVLHYEKSFLPWMRREMIEAGVPVR